MQPWSPSCHDQAFPNPPLIWCTSNHHIIDGCRQASCDPAALRGLTDTTGGGRRGGETCATFPTQITQPTTTCPGDPAMCRLGLMLHSSPAPPPANLGAQGGSQTATRIWRTTRQCRQPAGRPPGHVSLFSLSLPLLFPNPRHLQGGPRTLQIPARRKLRALFVAAVWTGVGLMSGRQQG